MKDIKKWISVFLAFVLCMTAVPFSLVNAETEATKMIYQIEPGKTGQTAVTDVTTSEPYFVPDAGFKTYVREDDNGLYYSTEVTSFSGEKYIYFNSGWNESTLPLLGNADVLNRLLDYMQISVDIRIVSESAIDKDINVHLLAYPNGNNIIHHEGPLLQSFLIYYYLLIKMRLKELKLQMKRLKILHLNKSLEELPHKHHT